MSASEQDAATIAVISQAVNLTRVATIMTESLRLTGLVIQQIREAGQTEPELIPELHAALDATGPLIDALTSAVTVSAIRYDLAFERAASAKNGGGNDGA